MERIASRYQVVGRLGEGASGEVLLCEDLTSGGRVALKRLEAGSAEATALLRRELEHLRRARHPHLVDVRVQLRGAPHAQGGAARATRTWSTSESSASIWSDDGRSTRRAW